jgi:general secretion pathway protein H
MIHRSRNHVRVHQRGLTVLEIMIVLAIIGGMAFLGVSAFRYLTGAALDEDSNDLASVMRRAQLLAVEAGVPTRVVIDFEKQSYWVETCTGNPALVRAKEEERVDAEAAQEALEEARQRLATLPAGQLQASSPEEEAKMAAALAGKKVGGRVCGPIGSGPGAEDIGPVLTGDSQGRELRRTLKHNRGVKFREVWVQHLEQSVSNGQVSISFFPLGWAEKAIIELGSDDEVNSVLVHGITGRVEVRAGEVDSPDDHMMRNARGDREDER